MEAGQWILSAVASDEGLESHAVLSEWVLGGSAGRMS